MRGKAKGKKTRIQTIINVIQHTHRASNMRIKGDSINCNK